MAYESFFKVSFLLNRDLELLGQDVESVDEGAGWLLINTTNERSEDLHY